MSDTATTITAPEWDLADRLRKALREGGLKPGDMRALIGVSESTMTNYLNGVTEPKDGVLRQWALACGPTVSFEWLKHGTIDLTRGPDGEPDQHIARNTCFADVLPFELAARSTQLTAA